MSEKDKTIDHNSAVPDHRGLTLEEVIEKSSSAECPVVKRLTGYLQQAENFKKVSKQDFADRNYMSIRKLSRILERSGFFYSDLLNIERCRRVCILINRKVVSADQIAAELGFASQPYFYSWFKQYQGITFAEFRQKMTENSSKLGL